MTKPDCPVCHGLGWVCENHPDRAWTKEAGGCQCGASIPCECNQTEPWVEPDIEGIIEEIGGVPRKTRH